RAAWPESGPLRTAAAGADPTALRHVGEALAGLRRAKTEAKVSQKAEITSARVTAPAAVLGLVEAAAADLRAAGRVADLVLKAEGEQLVVSDVGLVPA
ncbi:MAG: valine--tRNA ligase, partial [Actinomycetales bacterium]